jgi:hypothetical protein
MARPSGADGLPRGDCSLRRVAAKKTPSCPAFAAISSGVGAMRRSLEFVLGVVDGLMFTLGVSCGGSKTACDATSCTGCCDNNNEWQLGTSVDACGQGGNACHSCRAGETCLHNVCTGSATGGATGGGATGGGTGGGATGGGTGGGSTDAGMPPTFNLTFAASCGSQPTCGGNPVGTWFYTAGCIEDAAFSQIQQLCAGATISNKMGTASGSLVFTPTTVTRSITGSVTFSMHATDAFCIQSCPNLPSFLATYGVSGTCTGTATACDCTWTAPFGSSGTDSYTASNGVITLTSGNPRTFAYCVTGGTMQYTETTLNATEPGLYTLALQ